MRGWGYILVGLGVMLILMGLFDLGVSRKGTGWLRLVQGIGTLLAGVWLLGWS